VGASSADAPSRTLRHKFAAPGVPRGSIERPRLDRELAELFDAYSVVEVVAAPGAGKTVEAQLYARMAGRSVVWLTMDRSDASGSSLVFDLATAFGALAGDAAAAMRRTLHENGTVEEAAAVLAASVGGQDILLVVDECQQIASSQEAASTLDTFLEYVPESVHVLLLGQEELPWPLKGRRVHGLIAQLGDSALNLTLDETREYVETQGGTSDSAEQIFTSSGGWVAGVAFASRFGVDEQPNLRDLSAYFGRQVLAPLPEDEQQFLLDTSVTDAVTLEIAVALCGQDGQRLWSAVSARHLPATSTTASAIVIHSLFRSFLRQRLLETQPDRHGHLLGTYARHLARSRQFEDATEIWLSLGDLDEAQESAAQSLPGMFTRSDWLVIMRWLDAFGDERINSDPRLIGAQVRAVHGIREFDRARSLIRKLNREGRLRAAIEFDPSLLATAAWAMQAHPQEALGLLDKYEGDARSEVVRYMIEVTIATRPVTPPDVHGELLDVERLLSWGLFLQGRFGELARLNTLDEESPVLNPNVVLAAAFHEDIHEADQLMRRVPEEIRERPHSQFIAAQLALSKFDHVTARQLLNAATSNSRRTGFSMLPVYEIFTGYLELSDGNPSAAIAQLEPVLEEMSRTGQTAYVEWAQCFLGLAYLRVGHLDQARLLLQEAVTSMSQCQRRLMLALAAVGLSEVEARAGNLRAAGEAAELAYHVSMLIGTFAVLIQAVKLFPEVRRRELARHPEDSRWRRLVVAPSIRPAPIGFSVTEPGHRLVLQPFGRHRDLFVDGEPASIPLIKILELIACLSLHPMGIDRGELQQRLFPEVDQQRGGNHFRQITHKLRRSTGVILDRKGNLVYLSPAFALTARDIESERLLVSASTWGGQERRQRLECGIALACGPYLDGSPLPWVEERRNYLGLVLEEARLELATLYLEMDEPEAARNVCEDVLAANPYSDPTYRLLVQVERQAGNEGSAKAVYRRASEALAELGLQPGDARRLLHLGMPGNASATAPR
jgi:ATP/maltotriose-dependent transcriptional regulator MalT/DNA-binding SARP family transcriptional activator